MEREKARKEISLSGTGPFKGFPGKIYSGPERVLL
jgi:hypothetical protein